MPQPDSSSISTFTHLRPLLAYRRCSTGLSAVTVVADPNITCPTSTLTSACAFTYSITARAAHAHPLPGAPPQLWNCRRVKCARYPETAFMLPRVVAELPRRPRLLQWMCT